VVGCEQSHPSHRIITAYETIQGCQKQKENVEASSKSIYSCEKVGLYPF
jgi:hypothetical protein